MEPLIAIMLILNVINRSTPILMPKILDITKSIKGLTSDQEMTLQEFYNSIDKSMNIPQSAYAGRENEKP